MAKVERKASEKEVSDWLDYKNVNPRKREEHKEIIENLINSVEDGVISIDPNNFEIKQNLHIPIKNDEGEVTVETLSYVPRLKVYEIHNGLKDLKAGDSHGMVLGYASAITRTPKAVIRNLDTADYGIAQNIAIFFM